VRSQQKELDDMLKLVEQQEALFFIQDEDDLEGGYGEHRDRRAGYSLSLRDALLIY
jgi:hypothetical protein